MLTINIETARRFILGKQGLWPGRRWRGTAGTEAAMRAMEYLQLDPLQILARSQDITLHSRVLDYAPGLWEDLAYQQRKFFDWGGWLAVRPMDELPHWRVVMRRERDGNSRIRNMAVEHGESDRATKKLLGAMVADGEFIEVQVEGWKAVHYALGSDTEVLRELSAGRVPRAWTPLETTTTDEVVFLAPLEHVSARGRAKDL